ncbi:hypothetical protein [Arthrobacter sp. 260]|uniref:hypothetical protein n=1 Tax=Arthrobacter sp. 260 TaxID=2735314 RepID=UPI001492B99F|nr:hypothetical protein [Arthrobacter sp. 260]NOJ60935.1 hypothetical protein [Arthrobacter sp. 260]
MHIELLYTEGNHEAQHLREITERLLTELAPYEHVNLVKVSATDPAGGTTDVKLPVVRIDGIDIRAVRADKSARPLTSDRDARTEGTLRSAILAAALTSQVRMPLKYRRAILVASLMILVGALLAQFQSWGPILTMVGIALLAVALSNNGRRTGRQSFMWPAGIAALIWVGITTWFWWPVLFRESPTTGVVEPGLWLWLGVTAFVAMVVAVVAAGWSRSRLARQLPGRTNRMDNPSPTSTGKPDK